MKKKYYRYDLSGNFLGSYKTLATASAESGVPITTIWELLNDKKKTYSGADLWTREESLDVDGHNGPKILIFDLESTPMVSYNFGLFKQNIGIGQVIEKPHLISWAATWYGSDEVFGDVNTSSEMIGHDDSRITASLWRVLDEADIVVAHYGNKFDIPLARTRFIANGMPPTSPFKSVDTKQVSSRYFKMYSNKLDALATMFGIEGKFDTNFDLWKRCMEGNDDALDEMFKYNLQDVEVLQAVYVKLLPFMDNHPNMNVYTTDDVPVCTKCGSTHLTPIKTKITTSINVFNAYRCDDCGGISRDRKGTLTKRKRKSIITSINN